MITIIQRTDIARFLSLVLLFGVFIISSPIAYASTTSGPRNPGTSAGAGAGSCTDNTNWSNTGTPGNIAANDTSYVTISNAANFDNAEISDELQISNFGFSIPTGSKILGILIESIVFTSAGGASYRNVTLFTAPGTNVGGDKATGNVPTSDPTSTYTSWGSAADTWTRTWTATEVSSSGFGVMFCYTATGNNTQVNNDHIRATVTYDDLPTLSIAQPDGVSDSVTAGDSYNVTYTLADTDSVVTSAFYYDTNNSGLDGTAISGACATAAEGTGATCAWDTTGVTPGSYYVYGITNDGVNTQVSAYSSGQITINAPVTAPTVTTNFATNVAATTALLNGTKTGGSDATEHGFAYSTDATLATSVSTTTLGALTSNTSFTSSISSLTANTTYYFRAYATNASGTGYGVIRSFTTGTTAVSRKMRLFEGFKIKLVSGTLILHQQ